VLHPDLGLVAKMIHSTQPQKAAQTPFYTSTSEEHAQRLYRVLAWLGAY